jgi:hypothetical protein
MFAYLLKCFGILFGLWLARFLHLMPWSDLINLLAIVIVPMLIAAGAWLAGSRSKEPPVEHVTADEALSAVERRLTRRL